MKPRGRPATLVGLGLVGAAIVGLLVVGLSGSVVYAVTPTELGQSPQTATLRLYGVIVPGSPRLDPTGSTLSFRVTDGVTTVDVVSRTLPSGILRDGSAVVLVGHDDGGLFVATELLAKHSEVYQALAPGETMPPTVLEELAAEARP